MHKRGRQEGFGIVVVALLFTAFAVIAAATLDRSSIKLEQDRQKQIEAQLTRLNIALAKYARYNDHRLPCPASLLMAPANVNFGVGFTPGAPASPTNLCSTGSVNFGIDGVSVATSSNSKLLVGMVPVKELVPYGISYNEAFDPWGSRIVYAVHRGVTRGTDDPTVSAATDAERANVSDYITTELITPGPDTVVVSFGRDRVGGRLRNQASLATPSIACPGGERRFVNCDTDNVFIRGPLYISTRAASTQYFDDSISTMRYTP